jgi:hypothetical protein
MPLSERRRVLQSILPKGSPIISVPVSVTGRGCEFFELMYAHVRQTKTEAAVAWLRTRLVAGPVLASRIKAEVESSRPYMWVRIMSFMAGAQLRWVSGLNRPPKFRWALSLGRIGND